MSRYGFTRAWARGSVFTGLALLLLGCTAALAASLVAFEQFGLWRLSVVDRAVLALICLVLGVGLGVPLILRGQLVLIFLDQRSLLVRIYRELRDRREEAEGPESSAVRRLTMRPPR
jgi:hypothetical protein